MLEADAQPVIHTAAIADMDGDGHNDIVTAMDQLGKNPKIKVYYNRTGNGAFGAPSIVANTSSHSMKIVKVNGFNSLYGADYNDTGRTSVDLWIFRRTAGAANQP